MHYAKDVFNASYCSFVRLRDQVIRNGITDVVLRHVTAMLMSDVPSLNSYLTKCHNSFSLAPNVRP